MLTIVRTVLVIALLALGIAGYRTISAMRKPPAAVEARETALPVKGILLHAEDVPIVLEGYGTARARTRVPVSPEVGGRIVGIYPRLKAGVVVPEGAILFRVDQRNYSLRLEQARAEVERLEADIRRIRQQKENDEGRLEINRRSRDLAAAEFERLDKLLKKSNVGSRSGVEQAERVLTQAEDQVAALESALALYPLQIKEDEASLKAAEVKRDEAALDLERTIVKAPFTARLEDVDLEKGQVVTPGQRVLTLVDDSRIEVPLPLDSREMSRWFPFGRGAGEEGAGWFAPLPQDIAVTVTWTEDASYSWTGRLARVEKLNTKTNTAVVVIEVFNAGAAAGEAGAAAGTGKGDAGRSPPPARPPIEEGMFCFVKIPGRRARNVFPVPAGAVNHDRTVFLAVENRLKTVPIDLVHRNGKEAFIRGDLSDGDVLVTTRIAAPLEDMLLEVTLPAGGKGE